MQKSYLARTLFNVLKESGNSNLTEIDVAINPIQPILCLLILFLLQESNRKILLSDVFMGYKNRPVFLLF